MRAGAVALVASIAACAAPAAAEVRAQREMPAGAEVVIDTRPADDCTAGSTGPDARCLPPDLLFGPQGRLVDPKVLLWRLGTLGLTGAERVAVIGDDPSTRDAVAALLHIAGQAAVTVVETPPSALPPGGPGRTAGVARAVVFTAPMRDDLLILRDELAALLRSGAAPVVVDGRPEEDYWGGRLRTVRGGHLPGAQSLPMDRLRASHGRPVPDVLPPAGPVVAYAHGAPDGLAFFTALIVQGATARLYPGGWADWAASPLPADAETHPDPAFKG